MDVNEPIPTGEQDANKELQELLIRLRESEERLNEASAKHNELVERKAEINEVVAGVKKDAAEAIHTLRVELRRQIEELETECRKVIDDIETERDNSTAPLMNELINLNEPIWDTRQEVNKARMEKESLERQVEQLKRAQMLAAEWSTLADRWDKMTIGAPWREWAKDHQIEGGKKMVYEGRLILGDTMGLGKTLTSLIAIDMVEAATKDAAPDNPIEFGRL